MPPEIRQVRFAARLVSIMSPIVQLFMGEEVVIGQRPSQLLAQSVPISVRRLSKRQFSCFAEQIHGGLLPTVDGCLRAGESPNRAYGAI